MHTYCHVRERREFMLAETYANKQKYCVNGLKFIPNLMCPTLTGHISSIELTTDVQPTELPAGMLDVIAIRNELKKFPSVYVYSINVCIILLQRCSRETQNPNGKNPSLHELNQSSLIAYKKRHNHVYYNCITVHIWRASPQCRFAHAYPHRITRLALCARISVLNMASANERYTLLSISLTD